MSWWKRVASGVQSLFHKQRLEADLDEELRFHLEMQIDENMRCGMSRDAARTAAMRSFGGLEQIKEACRDARGLSWLEAFWQDLRYGARMLTRSPAFTLVAVLTLALGIGANTAVFSVVCAVLLRPLPFQDPDRLVMLWQANPSMGIVDDPPCAADVWEWTEQSRCFEAFGFVANDSPPTRNFVLQRGDRVERIRGRFATAGLFEVLGVPPLLGRAFDEEEYELGSERAAVLSYGFWQRAFAGDPDVVGDTLQIEGVRQGSCTVVGVMPPDFVFPADCDVWLSFSAHPWHRRDRLVHDLWVVGRLKPGMTLAAAQAEMNRLQQRLAESHPQAPRVATQVAIVPLLDQALGRHTRPALRLLVGSVGVVLLIACANVANLLLARAVSRRKEIAVRIALGAGRSRIVRQLLTECLLLAVLGGALGVLLAVAGIRFLPAFNVETGGGIQEFRINRFHEVRVDLPVLWFTALVAVGTSVLFGLVPALQSSGLELNESLKEEGRTATAGAGGHRLRQMLLVGQVALAVVLVVWSAVFVQSFQRLTASDVGFQPQQVLAATIDLDVAKRRYSGSSQDMTFQILQDARAIPGVISAAAISTLPLTRSGGQMVLIVEGQPEAPPSELPTVDRRFVTPEFFQTLGVPLLKGRDFSERDMDGMPQVCIVNETLARRFFPGEDPIGKRIIVAHPAFNLRQSGFREIIGVMGDVRTFNRDTPVQPEAFQCYRQNPPNSWGGGEVVLPVIFRTIGEPTRIVASLRQTIEGDGSSGRVLDNVQTVEGLLSETAGQQRFRTVLMSLFAGLALLLAAVGLYGVMSYTVSQRTHEIGIRVALGAQSSHVLRLIVGQGLRLCLLGIVLGLAAALAGGRVLSSLLYGIDSNDPPTIIAVSAVLLLVGLTACYLPARRALRVDPMVALRYE